MHELGVVTGFEAAHRLKGDFGPATRLHGHTYRVEIRFFGRRLQDDGTLLDLSLLQKAIVAVVDPLHYQDLDEVPSLRGQNTTVETMAQYIGEALSRQLAGGDLSGLEVRVWESDRVFGGFHTSLE